MPRSVNSVASRSQEKKGSKQTKGNFGSRNNVITVAKILSTKVWGMRIATGGREKRAGVQVRYGFKGSMQVFTSMI